MIRGCSTFPGWGRTYKRRGEGGWGSRGEPAGLLYLDEDAYHHSIASLGQLLDALKTRSLSRALFLVALGWHREIICQGIGMDDMYTFPQALPRKEECMTTFVPDRRLVPVRAQEWRKRSRRTRGSHRIYR